jgi:hypothetical protein
MSFLITPSAETRVNTTTAGEQYQPAVAALSDGGYVVTWGSLSQDGSAFDLSSQNGSAFDIYAQRYDATGNTVGSETRVNTTTANQQFYPWVTGLSDGGYVENQHLGNMEREGRSIEVTD